MVFNISGGFRKGTEETFDSGLVFCEDMDDCWKTTDQHQNKIAMVNSNNYVSSFMDDSLGGDRSRLMVNELVPCVVL